MVRADALGIAADIQFADFFGWEDGTEPPKGQRRRAELKGDLSDDKGHVEIDYTLHWQADRLTVSVKNNRPLDRNYIVYVVVEETLGSGEVLHTVERIPVIGQLTYVPQSFFDQEFEALAKTARFFRDFAAKYAKSLRDIPRPGNPEPGWRVEGLLGVDPAVLAGDPVLRALHLTNFDRAEDFHAVAALALQHPPAARVLRQVLSESHLSESALLTMLESLRVKRSDTERPESFEKF
jgi:hypothetical protein